MIYPNILGIFNKFGGKYLPELIQPILNSLLRIYIILIKKKVFKLEIIKYFSIFVGRPTPIFYCKNLSNLLKGPKIFIKREDLNFTGAHKINNAISQVIIAKILKKKRIICETGAGMHGVAVSTATTLMNLKSIIYMGENDFIRQSINVKKIKLLNGIIFIIPKGNLKEAMNEAIKDWCNNIFSSYYLIGTTSGPHPYPLIVRDFQSIISYEIIQQINFKLYKKKFFFASVGGGSNSIGFFYNFINSNIKLIAIEAGGVNIKKTAASLNYGNNGILHGSYSFLLQDSKGNVLKTNSISAGLDYPGIGPEIANFNYKNRILFIPVFNNEVIYIFKLFSKLEGIIPAFESSHCIFFSLKLAKFLSYNDLFLINLSGKGDKDL